jgi:hypothetical protein
MEIITLVLSILYEFLLQGGWVSSCGGLAL